MTMTRRPGSLAARRQLAAQTQFLIFTFFGDYVLPAGGQIWTRDLVFLLEILGVSERALRTALSRMTRRKWLVSRRQGRQSRYSLTARGRSLLEKGGQRIFERVSPDWDGHWRLVQYSLPEAKRRRRHALRTGLTWLGFGRLSPGLWIAPRDRQADLAALFQDLQIDPYVNCFTARHQGPLSARELVQRCWDLARLAEQYRGFIDRYRPHYAACRSTLASGQPPSGRECFIHCFQITHSFQAFPMTDPHLPLALLPPDWVGLRARTLLDNCRMLLGPHARDFVNKVCGFC